MKIKNILILGANSYIGYYLLNNLSQTYQTLGIARQDLANLLNAKIIIGDSLDLNFLNTVLNENQIDIVINCVCIGNVDQCEKDKELALKINFLHVKNLGSLSKKFGFKLIHFSSNAVYDGEHPNYNENSNKQPKNYYGQVKALADDYIKKELDNYLLIRVMTLFGAKEVFHRNNPATMIIQSLKENKPVKLVNDLYSNLLFIDDLINFIEIALDKNLSGEYNISGNEILNRYEFGVLICKEMQSPLNLISECNSDEFPSLTARALNTSFDNTKLKNIAGNLITPIRLGIKKTIARMQNANH